MRAAPRRRQKLGPPPPHAQPCALPLPTRPACHCRSIPHTQTRRLRELLAALADPAAPCRHRRNPPSHCLAIPPCRCCGVDPQPRCHCSPTAPRDAMPSLRCRSPAPRCPGPHVVGYSVPGMLLHSRGLTPISYSTDGFNRVHELLVRCS